MQGGETSAPNFKVPSDDFPKVHKKCNHVRPHTSLKYLWGIMASVSHSHSNPLHGKRSLAAEFTSVVSGPPTATDSGRWCCRKAREIAN
ncbi:hypothetical protein RR48_13842 [Papilio machaon]|uniref:Uncharacterized protein n=1 Tax=Papilio machaon TaxID=76193 RepID=A0A194RLX7_PAPMA|nr:hypothetical protein RR48_13842 [Papilio machaon]